MSKAKYVDENDIINYYKQTNSAKATAKEYGISFGKAKKILISHGMYTSDYTADMAAKIQKLRDEGYTSGDIQEKLNISKSTLDLFTHYTRCQYNTPNPTQNAKYLRIYHKKRKEDKNEPRTAKTKNSNKH